jgi:CheY-like chemotaxis protein
MDDGPATGHRILLAEQEGSVRELMSTLLHLEGYETDEATTQREAVERLEENSYDLVVADLLTASHQPPSLLNVQQLKQRCHPIPVGIVTGWHIDHEAAKRAGFAFLLGKPFDLDELLQRIAGSLDPPFTAEQARQAHLIRRALQALSAGDWETLRALCAPTLSYYQLTRSGLMTERAFIGLEAYLTYAQRVWSRLPGFRIDQVVILQHLKGLVACYRTSWQASDGARLSLANSAIYRFRGEHISQLGVAQPRARLQALAERAQKQGGT